MKKKVSRVVILILFVLALLGIMLAPRGNASGYDDGISTAWGYPAPVDPWCEEAALLELPLPTWCMSVTAPVATATAWAYPAPGHTVTDDALTIMKIGGRPKGKQ